MLFLPPDTRLRLPLHLSTNIKSYRHSEHPWRAHGRGRKWGGLADRRQRRLIKTFMPAGLSELKTANISIGRYREGNQHDALGRGGRIRCGLISCDL
jgi:hypothetical protein